MEPFEPVMCYMYTVKWQKKGLSHVHILLWLERKIQLGEVDNIIFFEILNKDNGLLLFEIVCKNMVNTLTATWLEFCDPLCGTFFFGLKG